MIHGLQYWEILGGATSKFDWIVIHQSFEIELNEFRGTELFCSSKAPIFRKLRFILNQLQTLYSDTPKTVYLSHNISGS